MTTYQFDITRIEVKMDDVGEYDVTFMADVVSAIAKVVGDMGGTGTGFTISAQRIRPDEVERIP